MGPSLLSLVVLFWKRKLSANWRIWIYIWHWWAENSIENCRSVRHGLLMFSVILLWLVKKKDWQWRKCKRGLLNYGSSMGPPNTGSQISAPIKAFSNAASANIHFVGLAIWNCTWKWVGWSRTTGLKIKTSELIKAFSTLLWHSTAWAAFIVIWVSLERLLSGRVYGYMGRVFEKYIEWERKYGRVLRGSVLSGREYVWTGSSQLLGHWCHHWPPNISAVQASRRFKLQASRRLQARCFACQCPMNLCVASQVTSTLGGFQLVVKEAEPWRSFSCWSSAA